MTIIYPPKTHTHTQSNNNQSGRDSDILTCGYLHCICMIMHGVSPFDRFACRAEFSWSARTFLTFSTFSFFLYIYLRARLWCSPADDFNVFHWQYFANFHRLIHLFHNLKLSIDFSFVAVRYLTSWSIKDQSFKRNLHKITKDARLFGFVTALWHCVFRAFWHGAKIFFKII